MESHLGHFKACSAGLGFLSCCAFVHTNMLSSVLKTIPVGDDDEDDDDDLHLKHPFPLPCTSSLNSCFVVFGRED